MKFGLQTQTKKESIEKMDTNFIGGTRGAEARNIATMRSTTCTVTNPCETSK